MKLVYIRSRVCAPTQDHSQAGRIPSARPKLRSTWLRRRTVLYSLERGLTSTGLVKYKLDMGSTLSTEWILLVRSSPRTQLFLSFAQFLSYSSLMGVFVQNAVGCPETAASSVFGAKIADLMDLSSTVEMKPVLCAPSRDPMQVE